MKLRKGETMRIFSRILTLFLLALLLSFVAVSDETVGQMKSDYYGRESTDNERLAQIYFEKVDQDAVDTLDTILFEARTQDYATAILALQSLIEKSGDLLIPVDDSESHFVNFAGHIFEKINSSSSILAAYRRRFDPQVCRLLKKARQNNNIDLLVKIWRNYRPSSHVGVALYELGALALEQANWSRAAWCLQRAVAYEGVPKGLCLAKQAVALAEMGDEAGIRNILSGMSKETASEKISLAHSIVSVEECLNILLKQVRNNRIAIPDVALEAVVKSIEISDPKRSEFSKRDKEIELHMLRAVGGQAKNKPLYSSTPYHAQYADGKICVVHKAGMRVFDRDGKELWNTKTLFSYTAKPKPKPSRYYHNPYNQVAPPVFQEFPTIWGNRVFTVVPAWFDIPIGDKGCYKVSPRKLISIDINTGKTQWMTGGFAANDFRPMHLISFCTPPLCLAGNAYAVGYMPNPHKKSNSYSLYCLDNTTGRMRWEVPLYQTESVLERYGLDPRLRGRALMPSSDGIRIFVATDDGASICVNAIDGRIDWATKYPVRDSRNRYGYYPSAPAPAKYWSGMGSVHSDGVVLVTAADSRWLFAHDADSGKVLWKWDNKARTVDYIFGVRDSKVILCGEYLTVLDIKTGDFVKSIRVPYPRDSFICGRICASDTCLYWPTTKGIMIYELSGFKLRSAFSFKTMAGVRSPEDIGGEKAEYSGNLILAGDRLVAVSDRRITFYGLASIESKTLPQSLPEPEEGVEPEGPMPTAETRSLPEAVPAQ